MHNTVPYQGSFLPRYLYTPARPAATRIGNLYIKFSTLPLYETKLAILLPDAHDIEIKLSL
jgi:hypothetical protein